MQVNKRRTSIALSYFGVLLSSINLKKAAYENCNLWKQSNNANT